MIITDSFDGMYEGKDVEAETKQYLDNFRDYNNSKLYIPNNKIYKRKSIPSGYNTSNYAENSLIGKYWEKEKDAIRFGHDGMSGIQYLYLHYYTPKGQPISFRRHDQWINTMKHKCIYGELGDEVDDNLREQFDFIKRAKGINYLGKRREGKSNRIGNAVIHINLVEREILMLLSSKTERDAKKDLMGEKVRHPYDRLPMPLKPDKLKDSSAELYFGKKHKDEKGNDMILGKNNQVLALGPKATGPEGKTIRAAFADESPKTDGLQEFVDYLLPALNDAEGFVRHGFFFQGGVAGDWGAHGDDFKEIWDSYVTYDFVNVFGAGWYSLLCDEYGNEDAEGAVRMILTKRNSIITNKKLSISKRESMIRVQQQQFPLTVEEAMLSSGTGLFDKKLITEQQKFVKKLIFPVYSGMITEDNMKRPVLNPTSEGNIRWLQAPIHGMKYCAGLDAFGVKEQANTGSDGVMWIHKMENNSLSVPNKADMEERLVSLSDQLMNSPYHEEKELKVIAEQIVSIMLTLGDLPVAYIMDAPKDPDVFAKQCALLLDYWSKVSESDVRVLGEKEPALIYDWFKKNKPKLMMNAPLRADYKRKDLAKKWVDMKGFWAEQRIKYGNNYIANRISRMLFLELLTKLLSYNETNKKHDIVDGWLLSLIMRSDDRIVKWNTVVDQIAQNRRPMFGYRRK